VDLFSRIAAQHRGQSPVLRPVLPPRFAPPGLAAQAQADPADALTLAAATPPGPSGSNSPAAGTADRHTVRPGISQAWRTGDPATPRTGPDLAATDPQPAGPAAAAYRPAEPLPPHALQPRLARQDSHAPKSQADAVTPAVLQASHAAAPRAGPLPRGPAALNVLSSRTAPSALPPPLSAARVQALSPPPGPGPAAPVVHVHIDRIELRAPAAPPARSAPARAPRAAPQRSLADYLRGGGKP
jgi:hypothetical protein